ncbi:hypothetical protein HHK36_013318 [Tetracentron sinense]|uniref:Uncharacterized protein n=1 Tax=Tetracentron sinense TaxID=13715 RepID=A0A835DJJ7_TETSI|nr:hypothetical protein HHK36_013318 [Tetracentron sinense]
MTRNLLKAGKLPVLKSDIRLGSVITFAASNLVWTHASSCSSVLCGCSGAICCLKPAFVADIDEDLCSLNFCGHQYRLVCAAFVTVFHLEKTTKIRSSSTPHWEVVTLLDDVQRLSLACGNLVFCFIPKLADSEPHSNAQWALSETINSFNSICSLFPLVALSRAENLVSMYSGDLVSSGFYVLR